MDISSEIPGFWDNKKTRKHFELSILRKRCDSLGIQSSYEIYLKRLEYTDVEIFKFIIILFMGLQVLISVFYKDIRSDIGSFLINLIGLIIFIALISLHHKRSRRIRSIILSLAFIVVTLVDIGVVHLNHVPFRRVIYSYDTIMVLCVYLFPPLEGYWRPLLLSSSISLMYITHRGYLYTLNNGWLYVFISRRSIFFVTLNIIGLISLTIKEYMRHVILLHRWKLLEERMHCKFLLDNEKIILKTIIPSPLTVGLKENFKKRILKHQMLLRNVQATHTLHLEPYKNVSILIVKLLNYPELTVDLPIESLIQLLQIIFTKFDLGAQKCNVQRVNKLDEVSYYVAGLFYPNDKHGKCCVDLGLQMIQDIKEIDESIEGYNLIIRVGVHSGSVVAGVIGLVECECQIWSNDVDIARRIEATGVPGRVHISESTFLQLDNSYSVSDGTIGANKDIKLLFTNMKTYLVKLNRDPDTEVDPSMTEFSYTPDRDVLVLPKLDANEIIEMYNLGALLRDRMNTEAEKLPTGRIQFATYLDYFNDDSQDKSEDATFKENLKSVFFFFRNSNEEWHFVNEPDYLLPYTSFYGVIVAVHITIDEWLYPESDENVPISMLMLIIVVLWLIINFKLLWIMLISNTYHRKPRNRFSLGIYNISNLIQNSIVMRLNAFFLIIIILGAMVGWKLMKCNIGLFEYRKYISRLTDRKGTRRCFTTWLIDNHTFLLLISCYFMTNISSIIKFSVGIAVAVFHIITIVYNFDFVFEGVSSSSIGLPDELLYCAEIASIFFMIFVYDRHKIYILKVDFSTKQQLASKKKQIKNCVYSTRRLLNNIMPQHAVNRYLEQMLLGATNYESFDCVAVMFATIRNRRYETISLGLLDEIICSFDRILLNQTVKNYKIEKIKLFGLTYVVVCGLEKLTETSVSSIDINFGHETRKVPKQLRKSRLETDDEIHMIFPIVHYALQLLHIMNDVQSYDFDLGIEASQSLTIGIALGPIGAGIADKSKLFYDIWGHTVNRASRLDDTCPLGKIQIDRKIASILRSFDIKCVESKEITIEGHEIEQAYFLELDEEMNFVYAPFTDQELT